jgi:hypothetical protein
VKLIDLEPRWIHPNVFAFRCPHCRKDFLTIKNVQMGNREQYDLYEREFGTDWNLSVVPCNPETKWSISGAVENMTVTPSVDASNSGHWHGFITNGEIR